MPTFNSQPWPTVRATRAAGVLLLLACLSPFGRTESCDPLRTFADTHQPDQSQPTLPAPEGDGLYGLNPLFLDPAAGDSSIPTNSPATARGRRWPGVWADLLERCYATPPSIGAFEARPLPAERSDADHDLMPDLWESRRARKGPQPPGRKPSSP